MWGAEPAAKGVYEACFDKEVRYKRFKAMTESVPSKGRFLWFSGILKSFAELLPLGYNILASGKFRHFFIVS
jgi:hypothetical protein